MTRVPSLSRCIVLAIILGGLTGVLPREAGAGTAGQLTATPTPSVTPTEFPFDPPIIRCDLVIEPGAPRVGDDVRVSVRRTSNGGGYPSYTLAPNPLFGGSTGQQSSPIFELQATGAGTATLHGSTTDEFIVGHNGDEPIYSFGDASCSATVEVRPRGSRATSTPTPTATETTVPTPTNPPGSCCGESCGGIRFLECQAALANGQCRGWSDPCDLLPPNCTQLSGSVNFRGLEIEPSRPRVGDEVTLRFDVELLVYSVDQVQLQGGAPFLAEGASSGTTFQVTAARAGNASVSLAVTYDTERMCTSGSGGTYFEAGPSFTVTSPQYDVEVAPQNGGDGCQLDRGRGSPFGSLPLLIALALIAGLWRLTRFGEARCGSPRRGSRWRRIPRHFPGRRR
jgi:hypothetical protein